MKMPISATHNKIVRGFAAARKLFGADEADEVWNILRIRRDAKRRAAPEFDREQPILHADHADVLPSDSEK
jgi:hypothetical protein